MQVHENKEEKTLGDSALKQYWYRGPDLNRQARRRRIFFTLRLSTRAGVAPMASAQAALVRWTMPSP
jgi:hypothetical protein